MKGLIRNNFYSMDSNIKISFLIALFLSVVALFVKHSAFIQMIIAMQVYRSGLSRIVRILYVSPKAALRL